MRAEMNEINASPGRIIRPRQAVPMPDEWIDRRMIREDWAGRFRWFGFFQHPELANLVERHLALMNGNILTVGQLGTAERVEALMLHADEFYAWWFAQMDSERLLPDSP